MRDIETFVKNNPGSVVCAFYAERLSDLGKTKEAVELLRESIAVNPFNAPVHSVLAELLYREKNVKEAASELETALKLDPQSPRDLFNIGNIFIEIHELEKAESHIRSSLAYEPNVPEIRAALEKASRLRNVMKEVNLSDESDKALTALISSGSDTVAGNVPVETESEPEIAPKEDAQDLLLPDSAAEDDFAKFFEKLSAEQTPASEQELPDETDIISESLMDEPELSAIGTVMDEPELAADEIMEEHIIETVAPVSARDIFVDEKDVFSILKEIEAQTAEESEKMFADYLGAEDPDRTKKNESRELFDTLGDFAVETPDSDMSGVLDDLGKIIPLPEGELDKIDKDVNKDVKIIEIEDAEDYIFSSYKDETAALISDEPVLSPEERAELLAMERSGQYAVPSAEGAEESPQELFDQFPGGQELPDETETVPNMIENMEPAIDESDLVPEDLFNQFPGEEPGASDDDIIEPITLKGLEESMIDSEAFLKTLSDEELDVLKVSDFDNNSTDFDLEKETSEGIDYQDIIPESAGFIEEIESIENGARFTDVIPEPTAEREEDFYSQADPDVTLKAGADDYKKVADYEGLESDTGLDPSAFISDIPESGIVEPVEDTLVSTESYDLVESFIKNAPGIEIEIPEEESSLAGRHLVDDSLDSVLNEYLDALNEETAEQGKYSGSLTETIDEPADPPSNVNFEYDEHAGNISDEYPSNLEFPEPEENITEQDVLPEDSIVSDILGEPESEGIPTDLNVQDADPVKVENSIEAYDISESNDISEDNATATMADIYAAQGLYSRAIGIYNILVKNDPDNQKFMERLNDIKKILAKQNDYGEK